MDRIFSEGKVERVDGSCEYGNKPRGSIKYWEIDE
jgi:hypothetical protein